MPANPQMSTEEILIMNKSVLELEAQTGIKLTEKQRAVFITKSLNDLRAKKHAVDLNHKRKKILASKKLRSFEWSLPMDMHAKDFMLVKGVAATEGTFKSNDKFSRDNLIHGSGALSMASALGMSTLNIDHYGAEPLPAKYAEKYPNIGEIGDCGFVLDADIADNMIDGKKIAQTEFIGYVTNKVVYDLIGQGKFKGNSVEDMQRRADCDCGEGSESDCGCNIEGSRFVNIGLILEEIPDSHGTWISQVTEEDLSMWKNNKKNSEPEIEFLHMTPKQNAHHYNLTHNARNASRALEDYMDDQGTFTNGKAGIMEYLQEEKELSDIDSKHLADFLYSNPKILTGYQLEGMSGMDLMEWFKHVIIQRALRKHKAHVAPNEDGTCGEGFELSEDGTECIEMSARADLLEDGSCPEGFTLSEDGTQCIEDPVEAATETMVPNEDGTCNEGWTLSEDGSECTREVDESIEDGEIETMAPNEDGTCPEGWNLSEDGTECLRAPLIENLGDEPVPTPDESGNCPAGWHASDDGLTCIQDEPAVIATSNNTAKHAFKKKSSNVLINKGSNVFNHSANEVEIVEAEPFEMIDYKTELPLIRNPVIYGRNVPSRLAEQWRQIAIHALETIEYLEKTKN